MKTATALLIGVLGPALLVALVAGAALGLVIGILLLVDSERVLRWNAYMNRWISTGNAFSVLDRPRDIKRLVYHWHRVVGLLWSRRPLLRECAGVWLRHRAAGAQLPRPGQPDGFAADG